MQGWIQISSKIAENMIDEYLYWMVICFFCIKEIVITSNYAKRGIYHLSDAKMKEPQMPDFNSY